MSDKLSEKELLRALKDSFGENKLNLQAFQHDFSQEEFNNRMEKLNKAEEQIVALIQKPEITEEFKEERAKELMDLFRRWREEHEELPLHTAKNIISLLIKGARIKKPETTERQKITEDWAQGKAKEIFDLIIQAQDEDISDPVMALQFLGLSLDIVTSIIAELATKINLKEVS